MINGFEYRDNLPKCPERSDRWLSPSNYECEYESDDECDSYDGDEYECDSYDENGNDESGSSYDEQEPSDDD